MELKPVAAKSDSRACVLQCAAERFGDVASANPRTAATPPPPPLPPHALCMRPPAASVVVHQVGCMSGFAAAGFRYRFGFNFKKQLGLGFNLANVCGPVCVARCV